MRIVGFFLQAVLIIGVLTGVLYLFGGQFWMALSLRPFLADIKTLEQSVTALEPNRRRCVSAPAASSFSTPKGLQLRFLDDKTYVVELICTLIEDKPLHIASGTLPVLVRKSPGSSGLYVDVARPQASTFTLQSLRATKKFIFSGKLLAAGEKEPSTYEQTLPATVCAGWGAQCCSVPNQRGVGSEQVDGVLDCRGSCYTSCRALPTITSFVSDPYPLESNEVRMESDSLTVTFSYSAEYSGGAISSVRIEYGDGTSDTATLPTGVFTHTYSCSGPCRNQAILTAFDAAGNSSLASDISTLYIVRK